MTTALQIVRLVAVMALVCVAAALATPKGQLPLVLRGVRRMLARDRGEKVPERAFVPASTGRRTLAFLLILVALILALV